MRFCTRCGNPIEASLQFCTQCGAPVSASRQPEMTRMADAPHAAAEPAPQPQPIPVSALPPATEWQTSPAGPTQPSGAGSKSGCLPTALIVLAVLVVVAALGVGGTIYVGYKVKQKATAALHKAAAGITTPSDATPGSQPASKSDGTPGSPTTSAQDDASKLLGNLTSMLGGDDDGDLVQSVSDTDPVEPCTAAPFPSQDKARIPLREGTVITTAWGIKYEDVESHNALSAATPVSISVVNSADGYRDDNGNNQPSTSFTDTVCNADLASAGAYVTVVGKHVPHLLHGATRLRVSDKSFNELKSSGKTNFLYLDFMSVGDGEKPVHEGGLLSRVESDDVAYPMIVNDQRVTLPAIHIAGFTDSIGKDPRPKKDRPHHAAADVYILDDPLDPIVLLWKEKDPAIHEGKFRIEVIKIDFKIPHPVNIVEKQLSEQKRAVTYGIYFDFNKDTIKPESEPVLKQIVQAMTDNPTWKLTVEGHTDNIGGDSYNLDLSKRRAAAVKQALVTRYHIAPDRLSTDGFGASRPIETNDTLEGRARNRRVELTRE